MSMDHVGGRWTVKRQLVYIMHLDQDVRKEMMKIDPMCFRMILRKQKKKATHVIHKTGFQTLESNVLRRALSLFKQKERDGGDQAQKMQKGWPELERCRKWQNDHRTEACPL